MRHTRGAQICAKLLTIRSRRARILGRMLTLSVTLVVASFVASSAVVPAEARVLPHERRTLATDFKSPFIGARGRSRWFEIAIHDVRAPESQSRQGHSGVLCPRVDSMRLLMGRLEVECRESHAYTSDARVISDPRAPPSA
jgi:hypothetical protein